MLPPMPSAPYQRTGDSVMDMIFNAGPMVKFVLLILMALSMACWCVIVLKYRTDPPRKPGVE